LRIPLKDGREFTERDGADAPLVAIVSQSLARRYFPGENPIGKRLKMGNASAAGPWWTVAGVAGDIRHNEGDREPRRTLYRPYRQAPPRAFGVVMRTGGDPLRLAAAARAEVRAIDSDQPISDVRTFAKLISDHLTGLRYVAVLMGVFGLLALLLAAIGVYSVMAHSVTERTHEIGVRMAVGAEQRDVVWMVVKQGMALTAVGAAAGLAAGLGLARVLANLIFGVEAHDVAAFGGVLAVLAGTALVACWAPARRAARTDPMEALRYE